MKIFYSIVMSSFLILGFASLDHAAAEDTYHFSQNCKLDFVPDQQSAAIEQYKDQNVIREESELAAGGSPFDPRGRRN